MTYSIQYAYFSHIGQVRPNNEDNYLCCGHLLPADHTGSEEIFTEAVKRESKENETIGLLAAVLDGMGGETCGEVASYLGCQKLLALAAADSSFILADPAAFLAKACQEANQAVLDYQQAHRISAMGSTLTAIAFGDHCLATANLGDSRIYRFRGDELEQLSVDHVICLGRGYRGKAPLTQYLGLPEEESALLPEIRTEEYQDKDRYLLCSDGLTDMVDPIQLKEYLSLEKPLSETAALLLSQALSAGGRDNVTAVLCEISGEKPQPSTRRNGFWSRLFSRLKSGPHKEE
ncbi:MAG: serine/threonine-protein phosphatase [Blautia sp.]|nr:serine/threonine-protein phosphatase [Blautia sp.]